MPTMDEILDGEVRPQWAAKGRGNMLVPAQLLDQWRLHPRELYKIFQLFEEKLNGAGLRYEVITPELLREMLPRLMQHAWIEARNHGWVDGDMPGFRFEQHPYNPGRIGLVWEGRMVAVNFDQNG